MASNNLPLPSTLVMPQFQGNRIPASSHSDIDFDFDFLTHYLLFDEYEGLDALGNSDSIYNSQQSFPVEDSDTIKTYGASNYSQNFQSHAGSSTIKIEKGRSTFSTKNWI
jgi:hypothetical protein